MINKKNKQKLISSYHDLDYDDDTEEGVVKEDMVYSR